MKTTKYTLAVLISSLSLWTTSVAVAANVETMSKLDMLAIKQVHIGQTNNEYYLEVEITFRNSNPDAVKLRNGSFATSLETKEKAKKKQGKTDSKESVNADEQQLQDVRIEVGHATLDQIEIPGAANEKTAGTAAKVVSIKLGPAGSPTTEKMVSLWNVLGDPSAPMTLVLAGTAEVGLKLPRGWVFEKDKGYELDLRFVPAVQRSVLLQ